MNETKGRGRGRPRYTNKIKGTSGQECPLYTNVKEHHG